MLASISTLGAQRATGACYGDGSVWGCVILHDTREPCQVLNPYWDLGHSEVDGMEFEATSGRAVDLFNARDRAVLVCALGAKRETCSGVAM